LLLLILSLLGAIGLGTIYLVLNLLSQNKKNVIISVFLEAIYITFGVLSFLYSREYVDPLNYAYAICFYIGQSLTSISLLFSPYLISVYLLNRKSEETD
jgi:membrane protein CcdC involved in cytochrome C biogenesis